MHFPPFRRLRSSRSRLWQHQCLARVLVPVREGQLLAVTLRGGGRGGQGAPSGPLGKGASPCVRALSSRSLARRPRPPREASAPQHVGVVNAGAQQPVGGGPTQSFCSCSVRTADRGGAQVAAVSGVETGRQARGAAVPPPRRAAKPREKHSCVTVVVTDGPGASRRAASWPASRPWTGGVGDHLQEGSLQHGEHDVLMRCLAPTNLARSRTRRPRAGGRGQNRVARGSRV